MTLIYSNLLEPSVKCQMFDKNAEVQRGPNNDHDAIFCNLKTVNKHNILY